MLNKTEITITIEAREKGIPTASLITFMNHFAGILRSTAKQIAPGRAGEVRWEITSARMASPLQFTLEAICPNPRLPKRVVRNTVSNLRLIERRATLPEYMTDQDLGSAVAMVSVLNDGVKAITISSPDFGEVRPTQHLVANVQQIRQSYKQRHMSFRGRLDVINAHGNVHDFEIFDVLTDQKIRCIFPEERYEEVGRLLKKRVVVYGKVRISKSGVPLFMDVSDFRGLPSTDEIPNILEMAPLEIPGGLDAVEYVRRIRNGENI